VAIPEKDVKIRDDGGQVEMRVNNLPVEDYFNLPNALADGNEVDATVSFDVVWHGPVTRRVEVRDGSNGDHFSGQFTEDHATVTWSGSNELGFHFRSNPGDFSTSAAGRAFAELAHVRNGVFAEEGGDEDAASLARILGARGPQGEESVKDRLFAALAVGGTDLAPRLGNDDGPTPLTSRLENSGAGDTAQKAMAVPTKHSPAADTTTVVPTLVTKSGHAAEDGMLS
jgi:hypothetical protein